MNQNKDRITALLAHAKTAPFATYECGYHTLNVQGDLYKGQRDCIQRMQPLLSVLKGRSVVDLGCNVGGMLHALAPMISYGAGFDYNNKCVNTATALSRANGTANLDFFRFDLDKDDLAFLPNYLPVSVDVCMMLSIAKWIKRWKEVVKMCWTMAPFLIFETNGHTQAEQKTFLETLYDVQVLSNKSLDDLGQHNRMLLLCKRK